MKPNKTRIRAMTLASKVSTDTIHCPTGYDSPCEHSQIARREFCNRLLLTSSGLLVAASALTSKAATKNYPACISAFENRAGREVDARLIFVI